MISFLPPCNIYTSTCWSLLLSSQGTYTGAFATAVEPAGILGPVLTVVLISSIKDGIEDSKRHTQDNKINNKIAKRIEVDTDGGGLVTSTAWQRLEVGDCILIEGDQEIPADCAVLVCGGIQGQLCYVETAAIDGETNLKLKSPGMISTSVLYTTHYAHTIHTLYTHYTQTTRTLCAHYTNNIHTLYTHYSHTIHTLYHRKMGIRIKTAEKKIKDELVWKDKSWKKMED